VNKYRVKCLDARYDEDDEILVLNCLFEENGLGQRIVVMHRSDFHYKYYSDKVPHAEMYKTADLFKGKPFYLSVEDDPHMENFTQEQKNKCALMFRDEIADNIEKAATAFQEDSRILQRKRESIIMRGRL
jgi:hypothetical protein